MPRKVKKNRFSQRSEKETSEAVNPNITVEITMVLIFANADQLFMTAAQGGEARPDLMRLSSDQLGAIGER